MGFRSVNPASLATFNSATSCEFLECIESGIDDSICSKDNEPKHKTFAPSSFRCLRAMWFRLRGTQPDPHTSVDRALNFFAHLGTSCHEYLQGIISEKLGDNWIEVADYLAENPIEYEYTLEKSGYETRVETTSPYPVRFACDGIVKLDGEYYLLEIKSCSPDKFKDLTDPLDRHVDQVKCYGTILNLSKVLFVYIDRSYGEMKCYQYEVKPSDREEVIKKFQSVMWAAEYQIAPEPLPKGDSQCTSSMCPYYHTCKDW